MPKSQHRVDVKNWQVRSCVFLMYGTRSPTPTSKRRLTYAAVAKSLGMTPGQVQHYCISACSRKQAPKVSLPLLLKLKFKDSSKTLHERHIDFLLDPDTLEEWAAKTMVERKALFEKRWPSKKISTTAIWRIYRQNGVRMKEIRKCKEVPPKVAADYEKDRLQLIAELDEARNAKLEIVCLDEIVFSKHTIKRRTQVLRN